MRLKERPRNFLQALIESVSVGILVLILGAALRSPWPWPVINAGTVALVTLGLSVYRMLGSR